MISAQAVAAISSGGAAGVDPGEGGLDRLPLAGVALEGALEGALAGDVPVRLHVADDPAAGVLGSPR